MNRSTHATAILVMAAALAGCSGEMVTEPTANEPPGTAVAPPATGPAAESVAASPPGSTPTASHEPVDALLAIVLTDVRSGETFTLGELAETSGPVLLEPMAVWCSNCRAQQHEVVRAHEAGDFASVSLDVDLSESPADLAAYADREGFDWHFAMADVELYRMLQDRFGVAVTNPPSTPLIVIESDGTVRPLNFGVGTRGAEELLAELGAG